MSDEILVKVDGVSKKFCRSLKRSLWYGVQDVASELLGSTKQYDDLRKNEFWAVDNVSFELKRGECLGLIGPNGAGKSTLLKMLNGLVKPDTGRITMRGRVGALIELGAGFNPILTARENIYVNGSVLGFTRTEMDRKFKAIVDFAGIDEFVDTPVQNFSSGMQVRLGFAIAAQLEPDLLIIDEVLTVGDASFRMKCVSKISRLAKKSALIVVSHSMPMIARLASNVLVIDQGQSVYQGPDIPKGIDRYLRNVKFEENIEISKYFTLETFGIDGEPQPKLESDVEIDFGKPVCFDFQFSSEKKAPDFIVDLAFIDLEGKPAAQCLSIFSDFVVTQRDLKFTLSLKLAEINLTPGKYSIQLKLIEKLKNNIRGEVLYQKRGVTVMNVVGIPYGWAPVQMTGAWKYESQESSV